MHDGILKQGIKSLLSIVSNAVAYLPFIVYIADDFLYLRGMLQGDAMRHVEHAIKVCLCNGIAFPRLQNRDRHQILEEQRIARFCSVC